MGVNTDGEEMGPGSALTDGVELTAEACEVVQETENEKSLIQDADDHVGIQEREPAKGTGIPFNPLPKIPSQSSVLNTEHNKTPREHTDEGESFLSNTTTKLQSDADSEDGNTELSHGAPVFLDTDDTSADDSCIPLEKRTSPLRPAEIMEIFERDTYDASDAMYNTLLDEISPNNASTFKLELPFNPDTDRMDEEGYTQLYKAALEGHLEGVRDLISRGANPDKASKGGLHPLHAAAQEGHAHIVGFLILQGADVNVECNLGQTPLHAAASSGYTGIVDSLIAEGANVSKEDNNGGTPFNAAVHYGYLEAVKYLMTKGAKQNRYDGMTPLYAAAQFGHLNIVKFFISKGADVNEEDDEGMISLQGAASGGHLEVMEYLIEQGSDVSKADTNGWTPFNAAVQYGHLEAVKYLITKGATQNRCDGMTPLYAAAQFGHLDIVKFFISQGADVNEEHDKQMLPLHGAAARGHLEVMKYLIQQGSDVTKADSKGGTPFNAAVQYGHLEALKYLVTEGAQENRYDGMTPLYAAAQSGHLDIVNFFLSKGADVNEEDDTGVIPLHGATIGGHIDVMEYLIQQGSDVNKADVKGRTPFNAAVQYGHLEAVKYLLTKGAKQNRYDGMTSLYAAAQSGHLDIVNFFISQGADVNEEDDEGMIPLHGAAIDGNVEVMKYLIQQGSDVNCKDKTGWTPFNAAVQYGHMEAIKYLLGMKAARNIYNGITPLYFAARFGHVYLLKYFISNGDNVNEKNDAGRIPLHGAAIDGNVEVMKYLIQQGSDMNCQDKTGWTPFNAAIQFGHLEAAKYLMRNGTKENRYDGMTPLYFAAQFGQLAIVEFLISNGGDVNEKDDEGRIPLHGAAARGQLKVMEFLIQQGSDVNKADAKGWTPLNAAVQYGHLEAVKYLKANEAPGTWFGGLTALCIGTQYEHIDVVNFLVCSGYGVNERNECGKSPLHAACYNGNMDIVKVLINHNANVNVQDHDGWSPLHAAAQEGHQDIVDYLTLNGADINKDINDLTSFQAAVKAGHLNIIEYISSCRGDPDKEETGNPRTGDHQNLFARGYVTVPLKDADTRSRTGELASDVDNAEEGNDCTQADTAKRVADELSLKNLSTRIHGDGKAGNEEHNPFIHAQLKYRDKGEQDPMLDPMEAIKCTRTRKRDTITNGADGSSQREHQTWQCSGFDPPFLQTMETDSQPSEEPEFSCHSLIDKNRDMREFSSPMNAGNDLPINETSVKFESFPTHPPAVVHQKLYDGNPVPTQGTSLNPVWKIVTKCRTSVYRCPSTLALVQTFLQMIIALAIILAESPVLVAGSGNTERVTLQAGKPGLVSFHLQSPPSDTFQGAPYFTFRFESKSRPFCINGQTDIEGFKSPSQLPRFTTSVTDLDTSPCVNLMIDNVDTLDEDEYVLTVVWHSFENVRREIVKKEVDVHIPPGRAKCFITFSENVDYPFEVHCRATTGSVTTTLSCYQNDQKIDVRGDITVNDQVTRRIFWLPDNTHFSCCSHDVTSHVNETMCNDFEWPPDIHYKTTTGQHVDTVPTSVTTPTPQIESHLESGACRRVMLPSLWHFKYLFIYILACVTVE